MVAKGEIRRKGRVLKAVIARVRDGRHSLDCARCDGVLGWRRYVRFTPIGTLETDIRVPAQPNGVPIHPSSSPGQFRKAAPVSRAAACAWSERKDHMLSHVMVGTDDIAYPEPLTDISTAACVFAPNNRWGVCCCTADWE